MVCNCVRTVLIVLQNKMSDCYALSALRSVTIVTVKTTKLQATTSHVEIAWIQKKRMTPHVHLRLANDPWTIILGYWLGIATVTCIEKGAGLLS